MSQASRILKLLRAGPKTTREILSEVPSVVHSRVAQLREQGYEIKCERVNGYGAGAFRYTLLSEPDRIAHGPSGSLSGVGESAVSSSAVSSLSEPERRSEPSECVICGQQMLGPGLRCDECKQRALDGSEATTVGQTAGGELRDDEPRDAAASLPSSAGEQLRLVA